MSDDRPTRDDDDPRPTETAESVTGGPTARDDDPQPGAAARSAKAGYAHDDDSGAAAKDWPDDASKFVTPGEDDDATDTREEHR